MRNALHPARVAFLGLSFAMLALPALAKDAAVAQTACERDVARLCSGTDAPDERRILACLLPDRTRLSPACRRAAEAGETAITVAATEPAPSARH